MNACSIKDCGKPVHAKGYCKRHYQQSWSTGSPEIRRPNTHAPAEERFWKYVNRGTDEECWNWTGFRDWDGYGKFRECTRINIAAHRFSYRLHNGNLPAELVVRHKCNNPACVNPNHLETGTHIENMGDRIRAGHYARGQRHPMAKLSDEKVAEIRAWTGTNREAATHFGISESQVSNIKSGRQRKQPFATAEEKLSTPTLFDLIGEEVTA